MPPRRKRHQDAADWLIQRGRRYNNSQIASMAKARLTDSLLGDQTDERTLIQMIRLGLELGSEVGAGKDLTIRHQHLIQVPPAAQEMIARRIMELAKENPNAEIPGGETETGVRGELVDTLQSDECEGVYEGEQGDS